MIKAIKGKTLILGITQKNVDLLQQDRPIKVDLEEMGIKGRELDHVVIYYGETDQDIYNQMKPMIDPLKTIIHSDRQKEN